jgi:hypothetical protein
MMLLILGAKQNSNLNGMQKKNIQHGAFHSFHLCMLLLSFYFPLKQNSNLDGMQEKRKKNIQHEAFHYFYLCMLLLPFYFPLIF